MDVALCFTAALGFVLLAAWRKRRAEARGRWHRREELIRLAFWIYRTRDGWQWSRSSKTVQCLCGCQESLTVPVWVWARGHVTHTIPLSARGTVRVDEN